MKKVLIVVALLLSLAAVIQNVYYFVMATPIVLAGNDTGGP